MTEPFTVGEVSVRRAQIEPGTVAVVLGCGPVGLGIVSALHRHGVHPIIATEPTPLRRSKAERLGADTTLDPTTDSWVDAYQATGSSLPRSSSTQPAVRACSTAFCTNRPGTRTSSR